MKIKLVKILNLLDAHERVTSKKLEIVAKWKLVSNMKKLRTFKESYEEAKNSAVLEVSEGVGAIDPRDFKQNGAITLAINNLLKQEVELPELQQIEMALLEKLELDGVDLEILEPVLK
jgi:hypothetical protein